MKKNLLLSLVNRFAAPVAAIVCGLVLLFSPDTATAVIGKILGFLALIWALGCGLLAFFGSGNKISNAAMAVGLFVIGQWLRNNPMSLAAGLGRIIGICLILGAVRGISQSRTTGGRTIYLAEGALGLLLLLIPMTASRLVYTLCGLALGAAGIAMLISRIRNRPRLDGGSDPNIIDAL